MNSYQWLLFLTLLGLNTTLTGCAFIFPDKQEDKPINKITFNCIKNSDGEYVTTANNGVKTQDVIEWRRTDFIKKGFGTQRRCQEVTPKLQQAYDNDTLKNLTWGYSEVENNPNQRFKSLCTTTGKDCHTLILTLLESDDGNNELKKFTAVLNGDASKAYQNSSCAVKSGSNLTCTVDINKIFNQEK